MHTARLLLKTTAYDCQQMEKRFHALSHIHNVCVRHCIHLLQKLKHDPEYQSCLEQYTDLLKKAKLSKQEKQRKKVLSAEMDRIRKEMGLSEYGLQSYMTVCAKQYRKLLSSQQVQKEVSRVWKGVERVLFGDGKKLHFKKYTDFDTICGKTNTNGVKFDRDSLSIEWNGLCIPCKAPKKDEDYDYMKESLDHDISYCEIKRMMFDNGWHYYVTVYLKGDAPKKLRDTGTSCMGIDPGTSTVAGVSETAVVLRELAPEAQKYNKQIQTLLKHMDTSRRAMNPEKYRPDGTINRKNKEPWVYSNTYKKNARRLKSLYRRKSAYIRQSHERLCNELLKDAKDFIVEDMTYKGLQRRSGKTERQDKASDIVQKDGTVKTVHKYKRKKRFGKSLNDRAPALLLTILKRKCEQYGGSYREINTNSFKASQYVHVSDTYREAPLNSREKVIGGHTVQRDLYSAFLIRNADSSFKHTDREACLKGFEKFVDMQDELIARMKKDGISRKQCFGF